MFAKNISRRHKVITSRESVKSTVTWSLKKQSSLNGKLTFQPLSPSELWHWVHVSYGDELGLTSSDDDYVPPPSMEDMKMRAKPSETATPKVCSNYTMSHSNGDLLYLPCHI